ncbi:unnamed protein product, partial [Phaeothamnion confervicola]
RCVADGLSFGSVPFIFCFGGWRQRFSPLRRRLRHPVIFWEEVLAAVASRLLSFLPTVHNTVTEAAWLYHFRFFSFFVMGKGSGAAAASPASPLCPSLERAARLSFFGEQP